MRRHARIGGSHQTPGAAVVHTAASVSGGHSGKHNTAEIMTSFRIARSLDRVCPFSGRSPLYENHPHNLAFRGAFSGAAFSTQMSKPAMTRYRFTQTINAEGCGDPLTSGHIALLSPNVTTDP